MRACRSGIGPVNRLYPSSSTVSLVRALRSGIGPRSPLLYRSNPATRPLASVETPYQVETGSSVSQLSLRDHLAPFVAS